MVYNHEYCQQHPNHLVGGIYKDKNNNSKMQRKVCMQCILQFQIPPNQILSKEDFVKCLLQKSNQLNIQSQLEFCQNQSILSTVSQKLDYIQQEISLILKNFSDQVKMISDEQIRGDEKFLQFLRENLNPYECSQSELDFLVNFLEGTCFEDWMRKKKIVTSQISKAFIALERLIENGYKTTYLIEKIHDNFTNDKTEDSIIHFQGLEKGKKQLVKTTFSLKTLKNGDKVYLQDEQVLRIEKRINGSKNEDILMNLEQIKFLEFNGQYGIKGHKIKQWNYFWKGEKVGGGKFNLIGQKQGKWIDLIDNYWDQKKIIEEGFYEQGTRIDNWNIQRNNQTIGGGKYDNKGEGQKIGKWVELSESYGDDSLITYNGEYQCGRKVGRWDIYFKNQKIGGGSYDETADGMKKGNWVEILDEYKQDSKVTYTGEYKNGKKVGRWDIYFENEKIGGGFYNEAGDGVKSGIWIEISKEFKSDSQVTFNGEYKEGKKVDRWDIYFENEKIGGGIYNEVGDGVKLGNWLEISDGFKSDSQVIYNGEYRNGKKVGRWDIYFENQAIGCGSYDEEGNGVKSGNWVVISDGFKQDSQVTYNGDYKNGKKVGRWSVLYENSKIGGGSYNEVSDGVKSGNWMEVSDGFNFDSQVIYNGEYKNGKKVGRWDIYFKTERIGGGSYDDGSIEMKVSKWVEIFDNYKKDSRVTYIGEYKIGKKVGRWDIWFKGPYQFDKLELIGGGLYDFEGDEIKLGKWVEISNLFDYESQVLYTGEYKKGKKVGQWDILFENKKIGGGSYGYEGDEIKQGNWIEISNGFNYSTQVKFNGEYKNGKKVGRWDISSKGPYSIDKNEIIGGGSYEEGGDEIKQGNWVEISDGFKWDSQVTYSGQYINGKKIGRWDISYENQQMQTYFMIYNTKCMISGGGSYGEECDEIKQGNWMEISDEFKWDSKVTYSGQYINGRKVGRWNILFDNQKMQIILFSQIITTYFVYTVVVDHLIQEILGLRWVIGLKYKKDIPYFLKQRIMEIIEMGKKLVVGISGILNMIMDGRMKKCKIFINKINLFYSLIFSGGGDYDQGGYGVKLGQWVEILDGFKWDSQFTFKGGYNNGEKIGVWVTMKRDCYKIQEGFRNIKEITYRY